MSSCVRAQVTLEIGAPNARGLEISKVSSCSWWLLASCYWSPRQVKMWREGWQVVLRACRRAIDKRDQLRGRAWASSVLTN